MALLLIIAFVLLVTLPFSGQAFHIDDAIFWDFAKRGLEEPFSLHLDNYHLMGEDISQWRDTHPPLDSLYMSIVMRVTGSDSEMPLHLGFIIFPLIAAISMYYLARRFIENALLAALLLMATPAVMTMSHTLMADVPLMAFWLVATVTYIYGVDRDDTRLLLVSAVLVTIAILTGYQAVALFILLPAYPLLKGRLSWKNTLPLLIPAAAFLLFSLYNVALYGELPRFSHARGTSVDAGFVLDRIEGILLHTGATAIFPLAMVAAFSLRRKRYLVLPIIVIITAGLGLYHHNHDGLSSANTILYITFLTASLSMLVCIVSETILQLKRAVAGDAVDTDFIFLTAWLLVMLVSTVILLPHVTAKYTLTFSVPLVILAIRELEKGMKVTSARHWVLIILVLTLLVGTAVSVADYRLAASYRDFTNSFASSHEGRTVWFVGEWGFRHYMEANGYRYLSTSNDSPQTGDLIVSPSVADWPLAPSVQERKQLVETEEINWAVPLRLVSSEADAGFYGTYWGILPYSFGDVPVEVFEVYEVGPPAP